MDRSDPKAIATLPPPIAEIGSTIAEPADPIAAMSRAIPRDRQPTADNPQDRNRPSSHTVITPPPQP
jgi:hypothetical protein